MNDTKKNRKNILDPNDYKKLGEIMTGFKPSDLIVVAANPRVDMTIFAFKIAVCTIEKTKTPVLYFSLNMPKEKLVQIMLSRDANITINKLEKGYLSCSDWKQLGTSAQRLRDLKLFIDDSNEYNILDLEKKIREFKKKEDIGLIIVDYLQLITPMGTSANNRTNEIVHILEVLKKIACELNLIMIVNYSMSLKEELPDFNHSRFDYRYGESDEIVHNEKSIDHLLLLKLDGLNHSKSVGKNKEKQ